jgi:hypothetical protein
MGIKKLIAILATLGFSASALAHNHDGENKPFSISGDFAGSMSFYDNEYNASPLGAAGQQDDFHVDLIEINLEKNWSNSKLHLSIGYGSTPALMNNDSGQGLLGGGMLNVMNAYYQLNTSYGLSFSFGRFESPVGFETYNQMDNSQYTRSYGFLLAPFFDTGARFDYKFDMFHAGLIFSNGSGMYSNASDRNKTAALVVDLDPIENFHFDVSYVTGTEGDNTGLDPDFPGTPGTLGTAEIAILDVTAKYMINEMFDVAVNYIDHKQKWATQDNGANSLGIYANAHLGMFHLGARYEMFNFDYGIMPYNGLNSGAAIGTSGTGDNKINAFTLTARAEIDQNAMVLLEYRQDSSDDSIFMSKDHTTANPDMTDSFSTITAAIMYRF